MLDERSRSPKRPKCQGCGLKLAAFSNQPPMVKTLEMFPVLRQGATALVVASVARRSPEAAAPPNASSNTASLAGTASLEVAAS